MHLDCEECIWEGPHGYNCSSKQRCKGNKWSISKLFLYKNFSYLNDLKTTQNKDKLHSKQKNK